VEQAEQAAAARGRARIAISGGSTPKATFAAGRSGAAVAGAHAVGQLDLWWVDERCVPPDDPDSNYRMTREAMLDHVPLKPEQIHRMEGELEPEAAAARYESELRSAFRLEGGGAARFDVVQLGMGPDGHTASLFPHTQALHELDRLAVANHVENKDAWRVTLTWPVINNAAEVFFLIGGADKAQILKEVFTGPQDPERLPSQLISPAGGILTLLLDRAAAALLPGIRMQRLWVLERIE
jgi:6-phosphogluconolactonase